MTSCSWRFVLAWVFPLLLGVAASAADIDALVQADQVHVRSRPAASSESLARLRRGQTVRVLGLAVVPKPAKNEPARWARVELPAGTRVWASAKFIDAGTKAVSADTLQLRAGPSTGHAVVGRLSKGAKVQVLGAAKNGWLPVASTPGCQGYVPETYLHRPDLAPAEPKVTETPPPKPASAASIPPPAAPSVAARTVEAPTPSSVPTTTVVRTVPVPARETVAADPNPPRRVVAVPELAAATDPVPPAAVEPVPDVDEARGRKVRREGVVVRPSNLQAPSHFALRSRESGRTINFLMTTRDEPIPWKDYRGKVVTVTGREYLDHRKTWDHIPILDVETIEAIR